MVLFCDARWTLQSVPTCLGLGDNGTGSEGHVLGPKPHYLMFVVGQKQVTTGSFHHPSSPLSAARMTVVTITPTRHEVHASASVPTQFASTVNSALVIAFVRASPPFTKVFDFEDVELSSGASVAVTTESRFSVSLCPVRCP